MSDERRAEIEPVADNPLRRWRWTMSGTAATDGTLVRSAEETGEVGAERAGEAVEHVVNRGPWDVFDQDESVTITVEPRDG
jgi:hypothetical protein